MDVRCARCGIEYEFDDALISERGTMVRCTECGHQFRVHPSHVIPAEPDEWRVVVPSGRTLVFKTLRELQQGISHGEISRDATLLRGKLPPRPLGSIAELDPFFPTRAGANRQQSTLTGVAPPATSAPPAGPRPESTTGKVAIARVGLATIQVPANAVPPEVVRPLEGRKTVMGIGAPTLALSQPSEPPAPKKPDENTSLHEAPAAVNVASNQAHVEAEPAKAATGAKRRASEPPTLRDGEHPKHGSTVPGLAPVVVPAKVESQSAMKAVVPRPARRTNPTPATGTPVAATLHSAVNPLHAMLPSTPEKPSTDPPPAQRNVPTQISEASIVGQEGSNSEAEASHARKFRVASRTPTDLEESGEIDFQAVGKPIDSPLSSPNNSLDTPEPPNGAFIPTIPPMRLTSAEALKHSAARAEGSRTGRWLAAILFVALVSLAAVFALHKQSQSGGAESPADVAKLDQRLQGAREALQAGDLSLAHENLQASLKAGANDPRWRTLTARYDIIRADMGSLAVQLVEPADTNRASVLKRELADNVTQSLQALTAVDSVAASDPELDPVRIDALRLSGELEKARALAAKVQSGTPTPALAYSFAALELTQPSPRFKEVFEWLGQARAQDSGLGRAPVMLVLACAAGNRMENARAELQRLKLAARAHPLLTEMETYLRLMAEKAQPQNVVTPDAGAPAAAEASEAEALADVTREGDFRLRLRRAVESLARNELTRSEQLFRSVLAERPKDTEALTGLGDIARRHGNTAGAISYYERVLANNGQYLPALSALADMKLKSGDRAGAAAMYRRVVDQVGDSSGYGQAAAQHLRDIEGTGAKSAGTESAEKPPAPAEPAHGPPSRTETQESPGNTP